MSTPDREPKRIEQGALVVGIIANAFMAAAGLWVYNATGIEALFLDSYFTFISVLSGIAAVIISKRSKRTSRSFPHGHYMLEPLYAIFKTALTLALLIYCSVIVTIRAVDFFLHGVGEKLAVGPVIPYEAVMVVLCTALALFYWQQNKRINNTSTMLGAEAKATLIDGIISGGIGLGAIVIHLIGEGSPLDFLWYTGDFFITIALVALSIKTPITVLKDAFIELTNGVVIDEKVRLPIEGAVRRHLPMGTELERCNVHKTGMSFRVAVYLNYRASTICVKELREKKEHIEKELSPRYGNLRVSFIFP